MTIPPESLNSSTEAPSNADRAWPREAARILVGATVVVVVALLLRDHFGELQAWLEGLGPAAPLAFVGVYLVSVPLFFPVSVLGFLGGALFGFWQGVLLLSVGGLVSASIMYGLARWRLADRVRAFAGRRPRLARFLALAEEDSLKLMVLLRLSPLHFGLVSYLLGAARVRYLPYLLATAFVLPSAAMQAWVGYTASELGRRAQAGDPSPAWQWVAAVVGIAAAVALTTVLGRMARRALDEAPNSRSGDGGTT